MLKKLLVIFDAEGGYKSAAIACQRQSAGCIGPDYSGKATIHDSMQILDGIWNTDGKYANKSLIQHCQIKAAILPLSQDCDINNAVGQESISNSKKQISKEECNELRTLLKIIELRVAYDRSSNFSQFSASKESFADEQTRMTDEDREAMVEEWAFVDDDPIVLNADIDEMIEDLENDVEENEDQNGNE